MAYDKILSCHARLDRLIQYVCNPKKTTMPGTGLILAEALNCDLETAYQDMKKTKRRWGKQDGITIFNRRINPTDFERRILMKRKNDGLDHYRAESNRINKGRAKASNNLIQSKYVTLSVPERKLQDSRAYFRRVGNNLGKSFSRLSSDLTPLNNHDRLRIFHDFFRPGEERYYGFDEAEAMYWGLDFRVCARAFCDGDCQAVRRPAAFQHRVEFGLQLLQPAFRAAHQRAEAFPHVVGTQ